MPVNTNLGGICWYCYWGWAKPVAEIYERAVDDIDAVLPAAGPENDWTDWTGEPSCGESAIKYGPAHVVWADENWDCAESCLSSCDDGEFAEWHPAALEIVRRSLRELIALPDEIRHACPDEYDGENPKDFPPTVEMRKIN